MKPIKVLYLHPSNELYGADRSLLRLIKHLDKSLYEAHVAIPNDIEYEGYLTKELKKMGIPTLELGMGILRRRYFNLPGMLCFLFRTILSAFRLAAYARKHKIDLIHSNSTAVLTGGIVHLLTRIPHIWHVREILTQPAWLNKVIANILFFLSTHTIAVSGPVKDALILGQPRLREKITVIHNGINLGRFSDPDAKVMNEYRNKWARQNGHEKLIIGMIGRISHWKGQELLARAMHRVLQSESEMVLVMVGGCVPGEAWRREELVNLVEELGISKSVFIEDFTPDIRDILSTFDIFVLPSTKPDPFPTVILEAMAAGKPVIATKHGGAIEQVEDGITGLLVSPENPKEMAQSIGRLYRHPEEREQMGRAGLERLNQCFSVDQHMVKIQNLYESILSRNRRQ